MEACSSLRSCASCSAGSLRASPPRLQAGVSLRSRDASTPLSSPAKPSPKASSLRTSRRLSGGSSTHSKTTCTNCAASRSPTAGTAGPTSAPTTPTQPPTTGTSAPSSETTSPATSNVAPPGGNVTRHVQASTSHHQPSKAGADDPLTATPNATRLLGRVMRVGLLVGQACSHENMGGEGRSAGRQSQNVCAPWRASPSARLSRRRQPRVPDRGRQFVADVQTKAPGPLVHDAAEHVRCWHAPAARAEAWSAAGGAQRQ